MTKISNGISFLIMINYTGQTNVPGNVWFTEK